MTRAVCIGDGIRVVDGEALILYRACTPSDKSLARLCAEVGSPTYSNVRKVEVQDLVIGCFAELFKAVNANTNVRHLRIGYQTELRVQMTVIAPILASNNSLRVLDLSDCMLYDDGVVKLAGGLHTAKLNELWLSSNYMDAKGLMAIGRLLAVNKTITHVALVYNYSLNDSHWETLYETICNSNYTLLHISVTNNAGLRSVFRRNAKLRWKRVHAEILQTVIALAPHNLPTYVLLWIFNWFPYWTRVHSDFLRVSLISNIIESIRRIKN